MARDKTEITPEEHKERKRRRREGIIIVLTLALIVVLTTIETQVVHLKSDLPITSSILVFGLINLNAILILLLLFLVVRNLVKLLFDRRRKILGARLKTKLVVAFITLSLVPTILLFFVSAQFIATSVEYWFSIRIERSLANAVEVNEALTKRIGTSLAEIGRVVAREIGPLIPGDPELRRRLIAREGDRRRPGFESVFHPQGLVLAQTLRATLERLRERHYLDGIMLFDPQGVLMAYATASGTHVRHLASFPDHLVAEAARTGNPLPEPHLQAAPTGDFLSAVVPIVGPAKKTTAVIVPSVIFSGALVAKLDDVRRGQRGYGQLKSLKGPIKISHYITLSLVTLLTLFGATWFGFFMAKGLTVPLQKLGEGTKRIAGGDYDFHIDLKAAGEIGVLVDSFNQMTRDLKISKEMLTSANEELRAKNLELDQRRRYMEIVLRNVAAGVVSLDPEGRIGTINTSAEQMLGLRAKRAVGRPYGEVLSPEPLAMFEELLADQGLERHGSLERTVKLPGQEGGLTLLVNVSRLADESGHDLGLVIVFDDTTHLEKAQRMAAWREVARRIAHEVKNPLTPIKLSAQRLKRRYGDKLGEDEATFEECIQTIIAQTDELKTLVNEFSNFARLPAIDPEPAQLTELVQETINLYQGAHPGVSFTLEPQNAIPLVDLDRDQMKRVLINLFDNAADALEGQGRIDVRLSHDPGLNMVRLEVADDGPGIPAEDKSRLFEPYFSTKKSGTGLGLAIVSAIVSDHNGYIRVRDNKPQGTVFTIELPVKTGIMTAG
ncbi:MAG: HAMP domain-containing protein [Proteobacteria bacterium]|nr:HAMP domain-containing protein [Pseudomonadota bacterium]